MDGGYLDLDLLIKPNLSEDDHDIPDRGRIRIRAMSREEMYTLRKRAAVKKGSDELDNALYERLVVTTCVVNPALDINAARAWQQGSDAGELSGVVEAIISLSKLDEGADKSDLSGDGNESDG